MIVIFRLVKILQALDKARTLIGEIDILYTEAILYLLESYTL